MALLAYLAFALVSFLSFALFEGEWAAVLFGPLAGGRFPILGGVGLTAAMGVAICRHRRGPRAAPLGAGADLRRHLPCGGILGRHMGARGLEPRITRDVA